MTALAMQTVLSLSPVGDLPEETSGSGSVEINLPLYKLLQPRTENECQLNCTHIRMQVCWSDTNAYSVNYVNPTDIFDGNVSH